MPKRSNADTWEDQPGVVLGVVDWYEVRDWERLSSALERLREVSGCREDGWVWRGRGKRRDTCLAHLDEGEDGSLTVDAVSERDAERILKRLERAAGSAIRFKIGSVWTELPR